LRFRFREDAAGITRDHGSVAEAFERGAEGGPERLNGHRLIQQFLQVVRPVKEDGSFVEPGP
jgi:hypothetical protein